MYPAQNEDQINVGTGPPTKEEIILYYPPKFTWIQLKTFVNSGDLGLLKRDRKLQERYDNYIKEIVRNYGSVAQYLLDHRLQWGRLEPVSLFSSHNNGYVALSLIEMTSECADPPPYFTWETPAKYVSIIQNDWPYSVPPDVEHTLIWTKVPIYHSDLIHESIKPRIEQDGLWGFTGSDGPPPSPSTLPTCLPSLSEWDVTIDKLVRSNPPTLEEATLIEAAGKEVRRYVRNRWSEVEWETAWFVNPPRLQSVPGLAHIHVFARQK